MSVLQITAEMLKTWQEWPLEMKIKKSKQTILDWYKHFDGEVYVSFSRGKDSSVMLHLVRETIKEAYPDAPPVEAVFSNTGLEFPEIVEFVKTVPDVTIVRPKKSYLEVIKNHGYAIVSKEQSQYIDQALNSTEYMRNRRLIGDAKTGSTKFTISKKWRFLLDAPFKISDKCCYELKKKPFKAFYKKSGKKPYVGIMAGESRLRVRTYLASGCNAYDMKIPQSRPLGHWLEADIWDYIAAFNVPYCTKIYKDMGYNRTGCMWCAFGVDQEKGENRFQRLERTHPKIHKYCIEKMGLGEVLKYIGVNPYKEDDLMDLMGVDDDN